MVDVDRNQAHGGKTIYGACVGILMLEGGIRTVSPPQDELVPLAKGDAPER